jgi:non-specific serine/threonine protein kinase
MARKKHNNIPLNNNTVLKDYTIINRISSGGFSFVYMGKNNITHETVAIKEYMPNYLQVREKDTNVYFKSIEDRKTFTQGLNQFFEEMSVISHIKHRNIINIIDYFEMNNTAYIVTPYEYGMLLSSYISSLKYEQIRCAEQDVLKIFIGILEAVKALHENNILHLDLKTNNIWLKPNKEIIILDFGTSIETSKVRTQHFKTRGFAAPEQYKEYYKVLNLGGWTDYYGVGATMYNLLSLNLPTESIHLVKNPSITHANNVYEECEGMYHYKILEIVHQLCQLNPDKRKKINIDTILLELKSIIPFNYSPKPLEELIIL